MQDAIPLILAALLALGIIDIGSFYLVSRAQISGTFGLNPPAPDADTRAWLRPGRIIPVAKPRSDENASFRAIRGACQLVVHSTTQRHRLINYLAPSECADEKTVSRVGIVPERRGRRPKTERLRTPRA